MQDGTHLGKVHDDLISAYQKLVVYPVFEPGPMCEEGLCAHTKPANPVPNHLCDLHDPPKVVSVLYPAS